MVDYMGKTNIKLITRQISYAFIAAVMMLSYFPNVASAAAITGRSVTLSTSQGDASGVTYTLATAALPTITAIKSMEIKFCTSLSDSCASTPSGFSASSSALSGSPTGIGAAGWTVSAATAGSLRIVNASNSTVSSGAVSVVWTGVHNPTASNATFYGIISTYTSSDWTGTAQDTGSIALSTAGQITVNASVDETLTFTLAAATIDLGHLSPATGGTDGTHTMVVGTNANTGYTVKYAGTTLTSGGNTIAAMSGADYVAGTPGFGFNLAANTVPSLGAAKSGPGTVSTGYGTADSFKFLTGDTIAEAAGPSASTTYTFSYAAEVGSATPAGAYSTVITFTATANF